MTKAEFEALTPRWRGYTVYMAGERDDQPNIPNEENPYPVGSHKARCWDDGQRDAALAAQDGEE
jgi:hypothetical protein